MRNIIKKILKEEFESVIYLIMSDDEKRALTNPSLFSGQAIWAPLGDVNFYKFGYSDLKQAEAVLNIQPQKYLDIFKPKIVKFNVGYFKADNDSSNVFDNLNESEEFDWVGDIVNQNIKVGDVFYIVDNFYPENTYPMDYRPENVRYLFYVIDVYENGDKFFIKYGYCYPKNVTYNPKDYNSSKCHYEGDEGTIGKIEYKDALELVVNNYWRLMGNNRTGINESEEFDWLPNQSEIGLEVRVNGKPFHVKKPIHRQDEGVFKRKVNGWSNCYEIVGEEIFTGIDCYIVKLNESYPEVYFPKKYFTEQDFCGLMNESLEKRSDCVGINLSNLTVEEKIKVLEKLELIYNTFIGFSQYPWVDQIQYLVTDFTTPVTMPLKGKRDQCGRWFTSAPEDAYKEETDSYEVPISMDGTKVKWSREIDGREFLNMSFIDDTSKLFESEEDFGWVENEIDPARQFLFDKFMECKLEKVKNKNWVGWTRYVDKSGKILFLDNIETGKKDTILYFDYKEIYQKLEKMGLNYEEIQGLVKDMLYETHRRKVLTTRYSIIGSFYWLYETHRRKVLTTKNPVSYNYRGLYETHKRIKNQI